MSLVTESLLAYYMQNTEASAGPRLPSEYEEYKWLYRKNGLSTVYVDTGLMLSTSLTWELSVAMGDIEGNAAHVPPIGTGYTKSNSNFALWMHHQKGSRVSVEAVFGNGNDASYIMERQLNVAEPHTYKMVLASGQFYIDGELSGTLNKTTAVTTARKLITSGCWRGSAVQMAFKGYQGETFIYDDGVLVRDYVPCKRLADSHYGMYELVQGAFNEVFESGAAAVNEITLS